MNKTVRIIPICIFFILCYKNYAQSYFIKNALICDGTGSKPFIGNLRFENRLIKEMGDIMPQKEDSIIEARGLVLSPGFIDAHSHHFGLLKTNPSSIATASQGITTIVIGQDGVSLPMDTIEHFIKSHPIGVNVASFTGHSSLREQVLGELQLERSATNQETDAMKLMLNQELKKGSLGLSTGLEYEAAFYSSTEEVISLAKVLEPYKALYISHIRSEDLKEDEAIQEIIRIGREAKVRVQISHIKIADKLKWGSASNILELLTTERSKGLDITADVYPYTFWHSTIRVLFPDKQFHQLSSAELATTRLFDPSISTVEYFAPDTHYNLKTFSEIAAIRKETEAQTLLFLIAAMEQYQKEHPNYSGGLGSMNGKSMSEEDVEKFISWPQAVICSDGNGGSHPRGYGAFTRVLYEYVFKKKIIPLETAIYKMTGLTATYFGIKKRGVLYAGNYADLVLFNPNKIKDKATIKDSQALSDGIEMVWVNGKLVYKDQQSIQNFSGNLIRRGE